jgi:hypothetical protein
MTFAEGISRVLKPGSPSPTHEVRETSGRLLIGTRPHKMIQATRGIHLEPYASQQRHRQHHGPTVDTHRRELTTFHRRIHRRSTNAHQPRGILNTQCQRQLMTEQPKPTVSISRARTPRRAWLRPSIKRAPHGKAPGQRRSIAFAHAPPLQRSLQVVCIVCTPSRGRRRQHASPASTKG